MSTALRKKLFIYSVEEYNLDDEQRAELKRVLARILNRKVTGEVAVDLAEGGVNAFKVREVVKS